MPQPVFPTLDMDPVDEGFTKTSGADNRIVTAFEDGYIQSMQRFTDVPLRWSFVYRHLSSADYATLQAFYEDEDDANWGNTPIKWTDPTNSTDYFVYFDGPIEVVREDDDSGTWRVTVNFLEALGSYT